MTSFWSVWIIFLTLSCVALCAALLYWNSKNYAHVDEGESMGHEFDGIEELNNPLPKWWSYMYWFVIIWGLLYYAYYGLGDWRGVSGWQSSNQDVVNMAQSRELAQKAKDEDWYSEYDREMIKAEKYYGEQFKALAKRDITDLAKDPEALKIGQRLFIQNCAQCHGSNAKGGPGFPNLTDKDWLYGGDPASIKETLMHGRIAAMPSWEAALGEQGVKDMTAYVLSLSGRKVNAQSAEKGKLKFAMCAACHGMDGKGSLANNLPMGAPNLTDNIWLYGGSQKAVEETLVKGRAGVMPAWKDILGEDKIHLISAYIYRESNPELK